MPILSTASKAAVKDTAGIVPRTGARIIDDLYDSFELVAGVDEIDLFPTQANASVLRANYEKNPFSVSETVHLNRVGFRFNAAIIQILGADQATTAANVTKFMNNFSNATVEFGRTGGTCFEQEMPLKELMAVAYDVTYVNSAIALVHISTTPLVVLPMPIVLPPNESLKVKLDFGLADGFPATGATAGLTGGKLYLECHTSGYAFAPATGRTVGAQITNQVLEGGRVVLATPLRTVTNDMPAL